MNGPLAAETSSAERRAGSQSISYSSKPLNSKHLILPQPRNVTTRASYEPPDTSPEPQLLSREPQ